MTRTGPLEVTAVVSYDEKTATDSAARDERSHATQNSIKNATWAAFYSVTIYAVVTTCMWIAMREQNKIANIALQQSRVDERAWIEIDPIKPELLTPADKTFSATFICNITPKNVGKTVARDIEARASDITSTDGWDENAGVVSRSQDMMFSDSDLNHVFASHVPAVIAPNGVSPVPFRLTCQAPQVFPSGHQAIHYLIGRMNYCDQFNVKHWLRFCFYVVNGRGEIWACKNGNYEDHNDENPTPQTACEKPN